MTYKMAAFAISCAFSLSVFHFFQVYLPAVSCLISSLLFATISALQHCHMNLGVCLCVCVCEVGVATPPPAHRFISVLAVLLPFLFIFVITINYIFLRVFPSCESVCVCVCSFAKLFYVAVACLWLFDIIWIKKINPGHGWTAILIFSLHPSSGKQTLIFILFLFSPVVLRANQSFNLWNG